MADMALSADVIKIVLAGIPGLTAALVREYALSQVGIVIVGECRQSEHLPTLAEQQDVDVVVTARTAAGVPDACQQALFGVRGLPVIVIGSDGKLETYERHAVRQAAMDDLFKEIRRVASRSPEPPPA